MYFKKKNLKGFEYKLQFDDEGVVVDKILKPTDIRGKKAEKEFKKLTNKVDLNDVIFDADEVSIMYMSSVLAIANFMFNKLIAEGKTPKEAYNAVYKQAVTWKDANNKFQNIPIEFIAGGLQQAMNNIKEIISKY